MKKIKSLLVALVLLSGAMTVAAYAAYDLEAERAAVFETRAESSVLTPTVTR